MDVPGATDGLPQDPLRHDAHEGKRPDWHNRHRRRPRISHEMEIRFSDLCREDAMDLLNNHGIDVRGCPEAARASHDRKSLWRCLKERLDDAPS